MAKKSPAPVKQTNKKTKFSLRSALETKSGVDDYSFVSPPSGTVFPSGTAVNVTVKAPTNANAQTVYLLKAVGIYDPQDGFNLPYLYDLGVFSAPTAGTVSGTTTEYTFSVTLQYEARRIRPGTAVVLNFCEAVDDGTGTGTTVWQVQKTLNINLQLSTFTLIA